MVAIDINLVVGAVTAISVTGTLVFFMYQNHTRPRLSLGEIVRRESAEGSLYKIVVTMRGAGGVAKGCHLEVFNPEIGTIEPALVNEVRTRTSVDLFTVKGEKMLFNDHIKQERMSFDLSQMKDTKLLISITSENNEGDQKELRVSDIIATKRAVG